MSITDLSREGGISGFEMDCDECGENQFFDRTYFHDFINDAKKAGWKTSKDIHGEWVNTCPKCVEEKKKKP